jgi:hypothetical protein
MSDNPLQFYKRRVNRLIGNSLAPEPDSPKNYNMPDFNLYQKKAEHAGMSPDPTTRDILLQKQSLYNALNNSYDSERIRLIIDPTGETDETQDYLAIIQNASTTWLTSEHMIALDPVTTPATIGSTIDWLRTGYKYLIMFKDYDAKGYFSGNIERANYLIKWTDEKGNLYKQWAVVKGPQESNTAFRTDKQADISIDKGNNQFQMFLGKTAASEFLRRYNRLILKDPAISHTRAWIIDVIDDITNKDLVKITLSEYYLDQVTDNYIEGIAYNYGVSSTLSNGDEVTASAQDYVVTKTNHGLQQGQPLYSATFGNVYVNYIDKDTFNITRIINGTSLKITEDFVTESFVYIILIGDYVINGSEYIKKGQNYEYDLAISVIKNAETNSSYWYLGDTNNLTIGASAYDGSVFVTLIDDKKIKIKLSPSAVEGNSISLTYNNESNINLTKTIEIVSLIS